ncbi:hypothetical protein [Runella zeae]|uniref:hypothetical protein n=1 Tax=Runella zeae TaxID=94255 RepID=UPI0023532D56|nr:hypothetical protein [Runella zeae]
MPQFRTTLKKGLPIFYIGILSITLVDSVCSIISRVYDIQYSSFYPLSYTIYILVPFFISLKTNKRTAVIYAALLGAFDATIGWTISMLLKAKVSIIDFELTTIVWIYVIVSMMATCAALGLLGAFAAWIFKKLRPQL